ncbi:MAG: NUDIX domain-containing protein [Flavobacteriales bacterium]|nr:NUDIX domain-containing protein [Flavobacteriales bacterium]MBK7553148.1 NUDIX domain-containing protein [Flavobacteriales bacterium]MBK9196422.1 NUDIX domain-containing protein [Flavobacteriales bacterium]
MQRKYVVWIGERAVVMGAVATLLPSYGTVEEHPITDAQHLKNVLRAFEGSMADTLLLTHPEPSRLWEWFSARFAFVHAAGGAVTDERGRLLAMYRRNRWDLPKGKLDKGEAVPDAAVREVMEECGLKHVEIVDTIADGSHTPLAVTWHTYDHKGGHYLKRTDWFLMRTSSSEKLVAEADEDITEVKWMDRDEVLRMRAETFPTLHAVIDAWLGVVKTVK